MRDDPDEPDKVQIDWTRAVAGALAAVASAVLLSTLGAAGTVLGAAIGSFVVTVGSAMVRSRASRRAGAGLRRSRRTRPDKVGIARAEVLRAARVDDTAAQESHLDHADERLAEAREELDEAIVATSPVGWRERLSRLPWKHIGLTTLALFVVALVVITVFELVAGQSVSSITGGSDSGTTTIGHVGGSDSGEDDHQNPDDQPTGSTGPSESVSTVRRADRAAHRRRRARNRPPPTQRAH